MEPTPSTQPSAVDLEHLKLLSIFHYVVSGLAGLFACIPMIHLMIGLVLLFAPGSFGSASQQPPAFVGLFFVAIALVLIVAGWTFAIFVLFTGRFLAHRVQYMFCFIMACVECVFMPFGTVLGAFTLLVLLRPTIKASFVPPPSF